MALRVLQTFLLIVFVLEPLRLMPVFSARAEPVIQALTPDHIGFATTPQPTLYWYLSEITTRPLLFTLKVDDGEPTRTIIEEPLVPPVRAGVQRVRLKDYGITLRQSDTYQWFVSLVGPPEAPAATVVTGGMIEVVNCHTLLLSRKRCSDVAWYDRLEAISEAIEENPADRRLRAERAKLLKQGGLGHLVERYKELAE